MVTTTEVAVTSTLPERSQQIAKDGFGLGVAVLSTDALGHHAVQRTGHERQLYVEIHFHADHGGERVYMEELDGLGDSVFDEHALRVARHPFDRTEFAMVGQQDGRLLVSQFHHGQLAEIDRKSTRLNSSHLVISYAVFCLKKK